MIVSIQYLRVVAASMILFFHAMSTAGAHATMPNMLSASAAGVDIFFVISGFIMWQSTARSDPSPVEFLRRRLARIAPFYWFMTLLMCATPLISGTLSRGLVPNVEHTFASLAFIPWHSQRDDAGIFFPAYTPGWTLNFEMSFYLMFAACLWIADRRRRFLASIAALGAIVLIGLAAPEKSAAAWAMSPILLEFAGGICIGVWAGTQGKLSAPLAAIMMIAALVAMASTPEAGFVGADRLIHWGIPACFIVLGAVELERHQLVPRWPALLLAGDASYALYLTHLFVIGACAIAWHALHLWTTTVGVLAFFVVTFAAGQFIAILAHRHIELPLNESARRLLTPGNAATVAPVQP
ncbi:MAG: acyltransferase [Proteobacteria bacterium]|nr:acyltransferase [Pseudomonadota bacterium]